MIYLFLTNGFETIEALTAVDLLRRAKCDITTVSIEDTPRVVSSHNIPVIADRLILDCDFTDLEALILPGGPGHMGLFNCEVLANLIEDTHRKGKLVAAICAAPVILYKLGINVESTIFPSMKDEIEKYIDKNVCITDNIISANAAGSSIDFALAIITYLRGSDVSDAIANQIVYTK